MLYSSKLRLLLLFIAVTQPAVAIENFDRIYRETTELNERIWAQVNSDVSAGKSRLTSVEQIYIPKQGVIFTLISDLENVVNGSSVGNVQNQPEFEEKGRQLNPDDEFETAHQAHSENGSLPGMQTVDEKKQYQTLKHLSHQVREIQKRVAQLHKQSKLAYDDEEKGEIDAMLRPLQQRLKKKRELRQSLITRQPVNRAEKQKRTQAIAAARRKVYFQQITENVLTLLCQKMRVLPSLPPTENITVILKQGGNKVQGRYRDSVIQLSLENIVTCAINELSWSALYQSSTRYQF